VQTLLVPQVPPHVVPAPMHWVLSQQPIVGMQAPLQSLKVLAHVALHSPAPLQVKFPVHGAAAGTTHAPAEHVPAPMRLAPEQLAVPQVPVG
jgi:hypothetical protein